MNLFFLGTSAGIPTKFRNVSSLALLLPEYGGDVWLFDCGEATQHQIMHSPIKPSRISRIFITHMHGDHIYGIPGLLNTRAFQTDAPLTIYGPTGIKEYVETTLRLSESHVNSSLTFVEVSDGMSIEGQPFSIKIQQLQHRISSFGYRLMEQEKPGKLNVDKLRAIGIAPGPIYREIKQGRPVVLADGTTIDGTEFIDPPIQGKVITILGDTLPCDASIELAKKADLLIHEATHSHTMEDRAKRYYHSTSIQAATIAKQAQAKRLIINHISPRYHDGLEHTLVKEAQEVFPNTQLAMELELVEI
jgi:ribonuclease Z